MKFKTYVKIISIGIFSIGVCSAVLTDVALAAYRLPAWPTPPARKLGDRITKWEDLGSRSTSSYSLTRSLGRNSQADLNNDLLDAVFFKDKKEEVKSYLEKGADANYEDEKGRTPLYGAVSLGHLEIVKLLITADADVNHFICNDYFKSGWIALYCASERGDELIVELLLKNRANVNQANKYGETPLYIAAYKGHTEIVNLLLENDANVNQATKTGETPLYVVASNNCPKIAQLLLKKGADINKATQAGETPMYIAAQNGGIEVARLLLENGADINKATLNGMTPLHIAIQKGHIKMVQLLLAYNPNFDLKTGAGLDASSLLHEHRDKTAFDFAKMNLDAAQKETWRDKSKALEIVKILLPYASAVDPNQADDRGETLLYTAATNDWTEIAQLLLENGADIDKATLNGMTPLHVAAQKNNSQIVQLLLENGADLNLKTGTGILWDQDRNKTAFDFVKRNLICARMDHNIEEKSKALEIVENLLLYAVRTEVDVNQADEDGETFLYTAAINGLTQIAQLLLEKGADIDKATRKGLTPLHGAVQNGNTKMVRLLLAYDANLNLKSWSGATALGLAKTNLSYARMGNNTEQESKALEIITLLEGGFNEPLQLDTMLAKSLPQLPRFKIKNEDSKSDE